MKYISNKLTLKLTLILIVMGVLLILNPDNQVKTNNLYKWKYKNTKTQDGNFHLKERGLFGKTLKIPTNYSIDIMCHFNDHKRIVIHFNYMLRSNITIDELLYYHNNREEIEQEIRKGVRENLINYSSTDLFKSNTRDEIIKIINDGYGDVYKFKIKFAPYEPEKNSFERIELERAKQKIKNDIRKKKDIIIT